MNADTSIFSSGQTCVHVAAINGHVKFLQQLDWYGADMNAREGTSGYTALHYAVANNDVNVVCYLLTECKRAQPDVMTYGGREPLEVGYNINGVIKSYFHDRGIPSPDISDSESEYDSSDDDVSTVRIVLCYRFAYYRTNRGIELISATFRAT